MFEMFWISVGTLCAITTVLAMVMVLVDAVVNRYGEVTLTINGSRTLKVEGGQTLLNALKNEKVFIPSACGGRGSCGLCKVKLATKLGDPLPTELPWLTPDERQAHVRLSCQLRVKQDLSILVPEELLSVRQYGTVVTSIRDLTHDIKEVRLKLVDPPSIDFKAGQYIQFEVPVYELTPEPVYRAYSIASAPRSKNEIDLEIRLVPNGICTTYVHRRLKPNDQVVINGPYGGFFLQDTDREILMVAGGSGMAPIRSILHDMADRGVARKTRYFFGAQTRQDLFLVDEMKELEGRLPDFKFIPALSAPRPEDGWSGETGLVTETMNRHVDRVDTMEAYLCGSPLMIDACIRVLTAKGLPADRIFFDKFA